jgi:hypothetical protein
MSGHWPEVDRRRGQRRHGDRRADAANTRRTFIALFLVVTVVIVTNALYPFQWYDRPGDQVGAIAFLLSTIGDVDKAGDLPAILMFVPFGFLALYAMPLALPGQTRVAGALGAAGLLSVWIELARYQDTGHTTTMGHAYASVIGAGIGAGMALLAQYRRWSLMRSLGVERVELILLIMWAGDRLYPYVPVANLHSAQEIVAPLLVPMVADPLGTARAAVRWLMVAYLAETLGGWRWAQLFGLFVLGEFAGRVLIAGHALSQPDLLGAVAAFALWLVLRHVAFGRLLLVAAFAALVVVVRLAPFDFVGLPHDFGWLPFQSLMNGSTAQLVRGIFSDAFLYGGLIWLLTRLRLSFAAATTLTVVLVLLIAGAQAWTSGPSGEITDALVAALIGSVLYLLGGDETAEG